MCAFLPSTYRTLCIPVPNVMISGASTDRVLTSIPPGITAWVPNKTTIYCQSSTGSINSASLEIWTTGSVGTVGTSLLSSSPTALTNISASGAYQLIAAPAPVTAFTATGILIRQNAAAGAGNSGMLFCGIYIDVLG